MARAHQGTRASCAAAALVAVIAASIPGSASAARPYGAVRCPVEEYARLQFARWDADADNVVSLAEARAAVAHVLGVPSLANFPEVAAEVALRFARMDVAPPTGLSLPEFANASWAACRGECWCDASPTGDGSRRALAADDAARQPPVQRHRRSLSASGNASSTPGIGDVPGVAVSPGVWHEVAVLEGDSLYSIRQMTLYNSHQLRGLVQAWVERKLKPLVEGLDDFTDDVLEAVICGGVGECSPDQQSIVDGAGGVFGSFVSRVSVFLARTAVYLVPSFSLVQTFQLKASFEAQPPDASAGVGLGPVRLPSGGSAEGESVFDIVAMVHVAPGESRTINRFLSRTLGLPLMPAVALAQFSHEGGFDLDFSLARILDLANPFGLGDGGDGDGEGGGTPQLEVALRDQAVALVTAYAEVLEFDDLNANGRFDAATEPVGRSFNLAELEWEPITHATSDGSCMSQTDLEVLDTDTLRALCAARGLSGCNSREDRDSLIAYLEQNPVGCTVDVSNTVMLAVESRTKPLPEFPGFSFALQFVTATTPLENDLGAIVGPHRAKVDVEIRGFPFSLGVRPRLAIKTAHAAAGPKVEAGVDATFGPREGLLNATLALLDSFGNFPGLPAFPNLTLPGLPWAGGGDDGDDGDDGGAGGWWDWLPSFPWPGGDDSDGDDDDGATGGDSNRTFPWPPSFPSPWSLLDPASLAPTSPPPNPSAAALVMASPTTVSVDRAHGGELPVQAVLSGAAARALAQDPGLAQRARDAHGGDVIAALLRETPPGATDILPALPASAFAATAHSSWEARAFTDEEHTPGQRTTVSATAIGEAAANVGPLAGFAAHFFASVNASAGEQFVSLDTNSSFVLWDPAVSVGQPLEWRKAAAEATVAFARDSPSPPPLPPPPTIAPAGGVTASAAPEPIYDDSAGGAGQGGGGGGGGIVEAAQSAAAAKTGPGARGQDTTQDWALRTVLYVGAGALVVVVALVVGWRLRQRCCPPAAVAAGHGKGEDADADARARAPKPRPPSMPPPPDIEPPFQPQMPVPPASRPNSPALPRAPPPQRPRRDGHMGPAAAAPVRVTWPSPTPVIAVYPAAATATQDVAVSAATDTATTSALPPEGVERRPSPVPAETVYVV